METIIENNKLIADFMALNYEAVIESQKAEQYVLGYRIPELISNNYLLYHNSWDWLMPVIEKIEGLGCRTSIIFTADSKNVGSISLGEKTITNLGNSKIEAVYKTVVQFINWHNQQPHQ